MLNSKNKKSIFYINDEDENLFSFRLKLLKTILIMAFGFSTFIATLALVDIFPLTTMYMFVLYVYGLIHLVAYWLIKKSNRHYFLAINIIVLASLFTFMVMTLTVLHDEFRLVWFFLTSFGAFIMGGRAYGFLVTLLITLIVLPLYILYDINLSPYAIFTFFVALILFNTFAFFFLRKIENDSLHLETRVKEEIAKQQMQEQMLLKQYRMAHMGEMIDAIAHQWRQPLMHTSMVILNLYDAVENDEFDKAYVLKKLKKLSQVNSHMSKTVEDFRTLLKNDKNVSSINLDEVIEEITGLMSGNLKEIAFEYEKNNLMLSGFKNEVTQVLIILISNSIEILNEKNVSSKFIRVDVKTDGKYVVIGIEDNAGGIDSKIISKVFDPYFTT